MCITFFLPVLCMTVHKWVGNMDKLSFVLCFAGHGGKTGRECPWALFFALQAMAERLAENAHDLWAKRKREELDSIGRLAQLFSLKELFPTGTVYQIQSCQQTLWMNPLKISWTCAGNLIKIVHDPDCFHKIHEHWVRVSDPWRDFRLPVAQQ